MSGSGNRGPVGDARLPELPTPHGEPLLAAVTETMVAVHERDDQRPPVNARTLRLGDDLLACVLGVADSEPTGRVTTR